MTGSTVIVCAHLQYVHIYRIAYILRSLICREAVEKRYNDL